MVVLLRRRSSRTKSDQMTENDDKWEKRYVLVGALWGLISIFGAIGGMINVSGVQRAVTGSWTLDAILFLPALISWQLTKVLPENSITGLIVLGSPFFVGILIAYLIYYVVNLLKRK